MRHKDQRWSLDDNGEIARCGCVTISKPILCAVNYQMHAFPRPMTVSEQLVPENGQQLFINPDFTCVQWDFFMALKLKCGAVSFNKPSSLCLRRLWQCVCLKRQCRRPDSAGNATMSDVYFLNSSKFSILEIRDQRFIKTSEVGQVIIKKIEDVSTDLVYVANSALL